MVFIKEILPNPVGRDVDGEWIKLVNTGENTENLGGWQIYDTSGKTFTFGENQPLLSGEELIIKYKETKITLNNDGDTIVLVNNKGEVVDTLVYSGQIADDEIIIADRFLETTQVESSDASSLGDLAFVGQGQLITSATATPLLVALFLAVVSGMAISAIANKTNDN